MSFTTGLTSVRPVGFFDGKRFWEVTEQCDGGLNHQFGEESFFPFA